jgi:hypothetical protein
MMGLTQIEGPAWQTAFCLGVWHNCQLV